MNRKKALVSFLIVAMLLCSSLVLLVRATPSDWSKPRPSGYTLYNETIGSSKTDGVASIVVGVGISDYIENTETIPYDELRLRITTSANTRMGVQYEVWEEDYNYDWCDVSEPTGITGDNDGAWLDIGFTFLYYGVEYERVWVCSNGFLTLNKTSTNANSQSIPSTNEPNPVIAVFWRDLHPEWGGSITYGRDVYFNGGYYFVVSWNNVPDNSGTPQTFQVLIQHRQGWGSSDFHNGIFFQYKSITKSYSTTVGTEDQVGNKGAPYNYNNLHNQACLGFDYFIAGYRLERLKIKLTKSDSYARIGVEEDDTGGCNIKLKDYTNPYGDDFTFAIKTAAGLLLWKAGIIWKGVLITAEAAGVLANDISPVKSEYTQDAWEGDPEAWAYGDCIVENRSIIYCRPFDSTLATTISWKFTDANNRDHDLTVTAEAWYKDLTNDNLYIISTSSTLNMYINSPPNTPSKPSGPYWYIEADWYYDYSTSTTDPDGDDVKYQFDWGDGWTTTTGYYSSGETVTRTHRWSSKGTYYVKVRAYDHDDWSGWSPSLKVIVTSGTGCPVLSVYDGTEYVEEGLLDIHNPEGMDVVYEHSLAVTPQRVDGAYLFRLTEHPKTHSYIDQVKLYAVLEDGTLKELPLIWAWHSEDGNVLPMLLHSDEWKADTLGADLNEGTSQSIDLKFAALSPNLEIADFVFQIEGNNILPK